LKLRASPGFSRLSFPHREVVVGLVLAGVNFRTAPVDLREKMSFDAQSTRRGLAELSLRSAGTEVVILSTCNRVEITAFRDDARPGAALADTLGRFLAEFHGLAPESVAQHLVRLEGAEAVRHLFRVASSLDSMVPGESQIIAQVKEAYLRAHRAGSTGKHLNVLFQRALRVGKQVHTETGIARHRVSVSSVAVELLRKVLGDLSACTVLVLGAGETGKLTLGSLVEAGAGKLLMASRTASRARETAGKLGGTVVDWKNLPGSLAEADVVISSTSSAGFVLGRDDVSKALAARRRSRPLVIIDIAVPRDVDPAVTALPGVRLFNVDHLEEMVAGNIERRQEEFQASIRLIEKEAAEFERWLQGHEVEELIGVLVKRARETADAQLEKLWTKLPQLRDAERRKLSAAVRTLVGRILHEPIEVLKAEALSHDPAEFTRIVRTVCRLDDEKRDNAH
jgi:glutamyl-tRNA reductase